MSCFCCKCGSCCTCANPLNAAAARDLLNNLAEQLAVEGRVKPKNVAALKRDILVVPAWLLPAVFLAIENPDAIEFIEVATAQAAGLPITGPKDSATKCGNIKAP